MVERIIMVLALPAMFIVTGVILAAYALSVFFGVSTMGVLILIMGAIFIIYGARHFETGIKEYRNRPRRRAGPAD